MPETKGREKVVILWIPLVKKKEVFILFENEEIKLDHITIESSNILAERPKSMDSNDNENGDTPNSKVPRQLSNLSR